MNRAKLLEDLNAEIAKLQQVRSLLQDADSPKRTSIKNSANPRQRTYIMSASARKRIGDAQRARWEKIRKERVEKERAAAGKYKAISSSKKK